ncbi:MAG: hypothetical protein ACI8VE_002919 [Natrialbaceae archaeon]|jgi:hypothetical protein
MWIGERCTGMDNVKTFHYTQREDRSGSERLCWDCRWPYIQERVHPELREGGTKRTTRTKRRSRLPTKQD